MTPDFGPWKDLWTALGIPAVIGAWQVWWSLRNRGDAREDKAQELLSGQRDKINSDLRLDLNACRADLEITAKDRNRGWDLARRHHDKLWYFRMGWRDAVGMAREARTIANALVRFIPADRVDELAPKWGIPLEDPPAVPPFDDMKP